MTSPQTQPPDPVAGRWHRRITLLILILGLLGAGGWRYRITRPDYRLAQGEQAIRAEEWERVTSILEKLESAGHHDHAHLLRGTAFHAREYPHLALAELNKIRDEGAIRLRAAALSGRCLVELGELREAHRVFSFVLGEQPDHVDAHRGLAAVAYDFGQFDLAVEHLERVAELDRNDARPHRLIGRINKDMGQHDKAEAAYREALRRGLSDLMAGEVRVELAELLLESNRFADALAALGEGPAEDAARVATRAAALRGVGRSAEAVELLDRGIARFPAAPLHRLRGQLALDAGDHTGAVGPLERAVELAPADYRSHLLLAQVYAGVGRDADAKREASRTEEIRRDLDQITALSRRAIEQPWDAAVRLQLAELSDRLGMPEVARTWRAAAAACRGQSR